ncbi:MULTISPECIES: transcriptional repressor LexA [unclassified Fusibacter]|uniref:transcriptional repressor LexA n=1 Tax=unclassified Fusibacter TaxID=2624464 RepID=UPI001011728D|nr:MULTISPECIES: transcriptional repressor LexA [unclassified Fusibacter]MCK8058837.1 transcriptional repressor LexA [Fusibacter sp. A2]NPE21911.1 transcriptional repressor LexA [Fusibacter sp. A1]RXV61481.1 transcriptional repressor LexA [Fusibacter sp. A1]
MATELTDKQREILAFIEREVHRRNIPPAVREICEAVGLHSTSTVHGHLQRLEKKGYIKRDKTKPRTIEILKTSGLVEEYETSSNVIEFPKHEIASVPIIGKVTAGEPILAHEEYDETFPVPIDFIDSGKHFMLRVSGDSMIEAGIFDRDFVLVKQQNTANNGDMVVAMIEDSATVKTFYKEANRIRLQPENASLDPIYVESVQILGIVKGVFRKL